MKRLTIVATVIVALAGIGAFALCSENPSKEVVVERLDDNLPNDELERSQFLDRYYPDKHGASFRMTTRHWRENFDRYSTASSAKAASTGFDSRSLSNVLQAVLADHDRQGDLAYLPVAAYETHLNGEPVWIVSLRWEVDLPQPETLGHIRVYAFTAKDVKQVGFDTCR